jgi:hypothetical protein
MNKKAKFLAACSILMLYTAISSAQDYYGGGNNSSWRRKPDNNQPPPKQDEGNTEPSGYLSINFGFATPEGSYGQPFSQSSYSNAVGIGYGGYAQPGFAFNFSLGVPISHSNFGVAFMFGSYNNTYDLNSYVNSLSVSNTNYNAYSSSVITGYASAPSQGFQLMGGL